MYRNVSIKIGRDIDRFLNVNLNNRKIGRSSVK